MLHNAREREDFLSLHKKLRISREQSLTQGRREK